jgi:hypothetical protein
VSIWEAVIMLSRKISRPSKDGITIYACLEVAYLGFGGLTTIIGISMIIYFIWI